MSTTKDQLGQEDTDTSTHRHCHIQTEKCMPILMKVTNEYIGTHPPSSLLSTQRSWGVGGVGGVSHYTAQEIQTCTPQIGTLYVCIESLLTLGTLSLRSAHLGASALLAQNLPLTPSFLPSRFLEQRVKFQPGGTRNNAKRCGLMLPTNTHPESTGQPSKSRLNLSRLNFSRHMW